MQKTIKNNHSNIYLEYGYLTFPINLDIVSRIVINNETYFSKTGYHVSLINLEELSESNQKRVLDFSKSFPVKLKKITNIYRLVKNENSKSIIVRVQISGLKKLIASVNDHFGYHFGYPPTHITLFIPKGQEGGIGLNSTIEYKQLTQSINQSDSLRLSKSYKLIS